MNTFTKLTNIKQVGVIRVEVGAGERSGSTPVTFLTPFINLPVVILGHVYVTEPVDGDVVAPMVRDVSTTGFTAVCRRTKTGAAVTVDVHWMAAEQT